MRAAVFHGAKDLRVEEIDAPDVGGLAASEVLVAPRWCGICGTDLHEYTDGPIVTPAEPHPLTGAQLPQILGHEFSAEVMAVGSDVTSVRAGDRVSIMPLMYCGSCYFCRRGLNQLCTRLGCVGLSWRWGGLADGAVVQEYQVTRLPDGVTYEQGALIEPAAVVAYALQRASAQPGDSVIITGGGAIGALGVLAARAAGASRVFVSEPNPARARQVEGLGADAVFDPRSADVRQEIRELTDGHGVDVALECAGIEDALRTCLGAVRNRGVVVQVGLHTRHPAIDAFEISKRELSIVGIWGYSVHDWPRVAAQVESGTFPVERVVTSKIALTDVVERGFDPLVDPTSSELKILVRPE